MSYSLKLIESKGLFALRKIKEEMDLMSTARICKVLTQSTDATT